MEEFHMIARGINSPGVRAMLKRGGIGIVPTDTILGLVGVARRRSTVERIYRVRRRNPKKPLIVLIARIEDLRRFGVRITPRMRETLNRVWPGPVSVVLPCRSKKLSYLHRGTRAIAFRLPDHKTLAMLLRSVGPLVAPSANPEGLPPAKNLREARAYFGKNVDFYVSASSRRKKASSVIRIKGVRPMVIRK
ncbi:MAG: Sua5/YciO/YrdC/YwlC family protein [Candidatus Liptonbacteria bacterium]|nr:Sua5/YciO/YrdC/YwlC family protein [Candidatus Liptonbacteria bacterium]